LICEAAGIGLFHYGPGPVPGFLIPKNHF
jgi:hypothetical protein